MSHMFINFMSVKPLQARFGAGLRTALLTPEQGLKKGSAPEQTLSEAALV